MVGAPTRLTFVIDEETTIASQALHDTDLSWLLQRSNHNCLPKRE
jgi:hypothetical protein